MRPASCTASLARCWASRAGTSWWIATDTASFAEVPHDRARDGRGRRPRIPHTARVAPNLDCVLLQGLGRLCGCLAGGGAMKRKQGQQYWYCKGCGARHKLDVFTRCLTCDTPPMEYAEVRKALRLLRAFENAQLPER